MSSALEILDLPQLPTTWRWVTMSQACLKIQDGTHFSPKNQYVRGKYRYITAKNVKPWGLDLSDLSYLNETDHRAIYKRCDPQKGDVLLVKDGVNTGDAALNTLSEEFSLLSSVCLLRPKSELIFGPFLCYFLLSPTGYRLLTGQMTGTAIKRIVLRRIKESPVPIAPLSEQQDIVAEIEKQFSRLDEAVASLKRTKANLKRYKASVLKAAVEGKLTEHWRKQHPDVEPASNLLERVLAERRAKWSGRGKYKEPNVLDTSDLPKLPDIWTWVTWDSVLAIGEGAFKRGPFGSALKKSIFVPRGYKVYEQYCPINDDCSFGRYYITPEKFEELRAFEVKAGDFLVSCSGVTLGRITQVPRIFEKGVINQALLRVRLNSKIIDDRYFVRLFRSNFFQRWIFDSSTGSAIPNVKGVKELKAIPIPLPPLVEQQQIVAELERRLSVIDELEAAVEANLTRADRLRQSILQRAFCGQLARG